MDFVVDKVETPEGVQYQAKAESDRARVFVRDAMKIEGRDYIKVGCVSGLDMLFDLFENAGLYYQVNFNKA